MATCVRPSSAPHEEPLERVHPVEDTPDGVDRWESVIDLAGELLVAPLVVLDVGGSDWVSLGRTPERGRRGGPHLAVTVENVLASGAEFGVVQSADAQVTGGGRLVRGRLPAGDDPAVGAREVDRLVTVVPAHPIVLAIALAEHHVDDLALTAGLTDVRAVHDDPVTGLGVYGEPPFGVLPSFPFYSYRLGRAGNRPPGGVASVRARPPTPARITRRDQMSHAERTSPPTTGSR